MNTLSRSIVGIALAGAAMYFFDPVSGRRRRLLMRDELTKAARWLDDGTRRTRHDLSHRAQHIAMRLKAERPSERKVFTSLRGALKRTASHPRAIGVALRDGHVILRGDVLAHEIDHILEAVRSVPGVRVVTDHLTPRERIEGIRSAAANGWPLGIVVGAAGCGLVAWGIKERKTLEHWGQELLRASKREIDATLDDVRHETERAGDEFSGQGMARPNEEHSGDSRAQVA